MTAPSYVEPELAPPGREVGIGLVVPFDLAIDREYWRWAPDHVTLHFTRTPPVDLPVGVELARAVGDAELVGAGARSLALVEPAVIAYACTSGSFVGGLAGEERLRRVMLGAGARQAVTTSGALLLALRTLGARGVAVGTPYDLETTLELAAFLSEAGYETTSVAYLGLRGEIWRVTEEAVRRLARAADRPEADALFLSCTNLRTFDVIVDLEQELGKPVLSANQVTMWAALAAAKALPGGLGGQQLFARRALEGC